MTASGIFVTIDGPGGIGKSTTIAALTKALRAAGHSVHATAEPSDSQLGRAVRQLAEDVRGRALAMLVAADRLEHLAKEIEPHLQAGHIVLCDRYLASSLVLQRVDGVAVDFILTINDGIRLPDIAVFLNADPDTITRRLALRGTHHRFENGYKSTLREVTFYREAVSILEALGVRVITIDTGTLTPESAAARVAHMISGTPGTLADTTPAPDVR